MIETAASMVRLGNESYRRQSCFARQSCDELSRYLSLILKEAVTKYFYENGVYFAVRRVSLLL